MIVPQKISFHCPGCNKSLSVSASLSGKTAKCVTCSSKFVVPALPEPDEIQAELVESQIADPYFSSPDPFSVYESTLSSGTTNSGDAFADLGSFGIQPATATQHSEGQCPQCRAPLPAGAVLCIQCGFDMRLGKQRTQAAASDVLDFRKSSAPLRVIAVIAAAILLVFMLDIVMRKVGEGFDAGSGLAVVLCSCGAILCLLYAWRCNLRLELKRSPGLPPVLFQKHEVGPFTFTRRWNLDKYDAVWFVQKPWSTSQQIFHLIRSVASLGLYALLRHLQGLPEQVNYRAELRGRSTRTVVLRRGNETVKDDVNAIVHFLRDAGKMPLKNDIEMLR